MNIFCLFLHHTAYFSDTSASASRLGKARSVLIPPEELLLRFTDSLSTRPQSWALSNSESSSIESRAPCNWEGVFCDSMGRVIELNLFSRASNLYGPLNWEFLPCTITYVEISDCDALTGTLPLHALPSSLRVLCAMSNAMSGNLDLSALPSSLRELKLGHNQFSGPLSLHELSPVLECLSLPHNRFSENLELRCLPSRLALLDLSHNAFDGDVDLTALPPSLLSLSLSHNGLTGHVVLRRLPPALHTLDLSHNHFSGVADLGEIQSHALWREAPPVGSQITGMSMQGNRIEGHLPSGKLPSWFRGVGEDDSSCALM